MLRGGRLAATAATAGAVVLLMVNMMMGPPGYRDTAGPVAGRDLPLIFIGGMPRSGTTLMRVMLDAHRDVRCGQETRVIPEILRLRREWMLSENERARLNQAGVTTAVLDNAMASFCLQVIVNHGELAPRLCTKDPFVMSHSTYVLRLFPNAKFVFMVRDGRAVVHSIFMRNITIGGYDKKSYRIAMQQWSTDVEVMYKECRTLGPTRCMPVRYETLVLAPEPTLRAVLRWLDLPWSDAVLHHQRYLFQPHGVALSLTERSSDQVVRPVNQDALYTWVKHIPADVASDMAELAPMLAKLGYDPWASPPDYHKFLNSTISAHVIDW